MVSIPDPFSRNRFKNPDKTVMSQTERYVCTQTERYVCRYYLKQNLVWKICIFITDKQLAWRMTAASTLNNTRLNKIPITNIYIWNIRFWKYYKFSLHKSYFFKLLVFPFHFLRLVIEKLLQIVPKGTYYITTWLSNIIPPILLQLYSSNTIHYYPQKELRDMTIGHCFLRCWYNQSKTGVRWFGGMNQL